MVSFFPIGSESTCPDKQSQYHTDQKESKVCKYVQCMSLSIEYKRTR